jgi:putative hydrolase
LKIATDMHCHTLASGHAYSTADELIRAAAAAGLDAVAITDHGPALQATPSWYFHNARVFPKKAYGVEIFRGVEANILDADGKLDMDDAGLMHLHYVIASCHTITISGPDAEYYTAACINAMKNPAVHTLGHPDDARMPLDYARIVRVAAETHTLLELNNHSLSPFTPRPGAKKNLIQMLALCKAQGVPVVISSDAHVCYSVGQFKYSLELVKEMKFPKELIANTSLDKLKSLLKRNGTKS